MAWQPMEINPEVRQWILVLGVLHRLGGVVGGWAEARAPSRAGEAMLGIKRGERSSSEAVDI